MLRRCEILEQRYCLTSLAFSFVEVHTQDERMGGEIRLADLDGDGHLDIAASGTDDERTSITFGPESQVFLASNERNFLDLLDVDQDGDLDLITSDYIYENYGDRNVAEQEERQPLFLVDGKEAPTFGRDLGDIDGDGDTDLIISWGNNQTMILAWAENDGSADWASNNSLDDLSIIVESSYDDLPFFGVDFVDMDADGLPDLVTRVATAEYVSGERIEGRDFVWFKNLGQGDFEPEPSPHVIKAGAVTHPFFTDVDGDGYVDLVAREGGQLGDPYHLRWYQGSDKGFIARGPLYDFVAAEVDVTSSVNVGDLDGDGDQDAVATMVGGDLFWFEYDNGVFEPHRISTESIQAWHQGVALFDYNGDGKLDIVGVYTVDRFFDKTMVLVQQVHGDANGDGRFDSSDLVQIFQRGEYEDEIRNNSTYADGDWNLDDEFTSADLVFALQAGNYEVAPASVPTASTPSQNIAAAVDFVFGESDKKRSAFIA